MEWRKAPCTIQNTREEDIQIRIYNRLKLQKKIDFENDLEKENNLRREKQLTKIEKTLTKIRMVYMRNRR